MKSKFIIGILVMVMVVILLNQAMAIPLPKVSIGVEEATNPGEVAVALQVLFLLTILSLAPGILIMMTSFARIVVVLSFLRQALGTPQLPPNQVIIGLSLFITFFVMAPVWQKVNILAIQPYLAKEMTEKEALEKASQPLRKFMFGQTREKDLSLFIEMAKMKRPQSPSDISTSILIPAFMISELKTAFQIGFLIYIPFLVLDMVVASILMSMGMLMLPPIIISLPFKLMLFVLVDGWNLIIGSLVRSFA